jgi:hypothetical protein
MLAILGWVGSNVAEKRRWNDGLRVRARLRRGRQEPGCGAALQQVAGVTQAHACWGQPGIFDVEVDDMAGTMLVTTHAIPGIRTTETHVVAPV